MDEMTIRKLVGINSTFYKQFAASFSASRTQPQPGYERLLVHVPQGSIEVLDVGCGNARFGRFLSAFGLSFGYTGMDFSEPLLTIAGDFPGRYLQRDLSRPDCLAGLGSFDLIVSLSTFQHIPGRANRERLLGELGDHLAKGGRIILGNWQFLSSLSQRRKIRHWSEVGLDSTQLEGEDYLLSWERGGRGVRYVALVDAEATGAMAERVGLRVVDQFRSDGREGDLNLYTILAS